MPVAVAEFDRANKHVDHFDGDAWAAAVAGEIDTAIGHIPQLATKELRRLAHDTTLGP